MTYTGAVRADQAAAWLPEDFGKLLSLEVQSKAIVAQLSVKFPTDRQKVNFPIWSNGVATAFFDELDEITPSNGGTDEVVIEPKKVAGLHLASSELFDDSDPDIANQVGLSLANQISQSLDAAFTANATSKGFAGLLSKAYTTVNAGTSVANLDAFVSARYAAEAHGANLTHWLLSPTVAEALSLLKRQSGSNESLIEFVQDGITIAGLPVLTSTHTDSGSIAWGIDQSQQRFVIRNTSKVERFPSVTNDGQWVRGIMRAAWGTLNPAGLVRVVLSPIEFTVSQSGGASSDTFTLLVGGRETGAIDWDASADDMKAAIVAVDDGITADDVTVTGTGPWTVTLPAVLAHGTDTGLTSTVVRA